MRRPGSGPWPAPWPRGSDPPSRATTSRSRSCSRRWPRACGCGRCEYPRSIGGSAVNSGTVAAAMEGLVAGIPSIAVSYAGSDLDTLGTHKDGLRRLLQRIVAVKDFPRETLLNINLPAIPGGDVKGVKVTHLGSRVFSEEIALMKDPWGKEIYWIGGGRITWTGDADSDFRATSDGYIDRKSTRL